MLTLQPCSQSNHSQLQRRLSGAIWDESLLSAQGRPHSRILHGSVQIRKNEEGCNRQFEKKMTPCGRSGQGSGRCQPKVHGRFAFPGAQNPRVESISGTFQNDNSRNPAHQNRSDSCDLRLRCPSRTPEIVAISETTESNAALRFKGAMESG